MKRIFSMFLALAIMFTAIPCMSADAAARWSHLTLISGQMDIDENNWVTATVVCDCSAKEANSLSATCELQQLNGSWKTIKTWNEKTSGTSLLYSKNYAVDKGYSYRLKITARAYQDSKLLESVTEYFDYGYYQ